MGLTLKQLTSTVSQVKEYVDDKVAGSSSGGVQINDESSTSTTETWSAKKIAESIPTSLPADGGDAETVNNHTVESDVPGNAVFSDTVYDDTDIRSTLGINLFNGNWVDGDIDTHGELITSDTKMVSDYIRLYDVRSMSYFFKIFGYSGTSDNTVRVCYYKPDKSYIGSEDGYAKDENTNRTYKFSVDGSTTQYVRLITSKTGIGNVDKVMVTSQQAYDSYTRFSGLVNNLTIDDSSTTSTEYTWSAKKISESMLKMNDADVSTSTVWSSDKVASAISEAAAGGDVDLTAYQKKNDSLLGTESKDIVGAINEVKAEVGTKINYDDAEVRSDIAALQTLSHTHANKAVIDEISAEKIQEWDNKSEFNGDYNSLSNRPDIPTKLSELTNDSQYITKLVEDLINYYSKSETYSKQEIAELIGNINKLTSEIVESLPTSEISTSTIYLIKDGDTSNYKQYMYISGQWAQLSDTSIDLTQYAKKTELDAKVDKVEGKQLTSNDFTDILKSKLDGIAEGANKTVVDEELSDTSNNPVTNAVITGKINTLANKDGSNATGTWNMDISGTAAKATGDKNGNDITTTYAKQADLAAAAGSLTVLDYTSQITKNTDAISSLWSTNIRKAGHIVIFVVNITVKAANTFTIRLGTLPKEVRPPASIGINTVTNTGKPCYIYINDDGTFGFTKITETTWTANEGVRFCVDYMTEN